MLSATSHNTSWGADLLDRLENQYINASVVTVYHDGYLFIFVFVYRCMSLYMEGKYNDMMTVDT